MGSHPHMMTLKSLSFSPVCSGLYIQTNITRWLGNIFIFTVFRLLENTFCETRYPSPYVEQSLHKLSPQNLCPHEKLFLEKSSSSPYFSVGGNNMKWSPKIRLKAKGIN